MNRTAKLVSTIAACALSVGMLAGCSNDTDSKEVSHRGVTQTSSINTRCPYSGEPVDSAVTTSYKGKNVAFCCTKCQAKFDKATEAEKDKMISAAK